MSRKPSDRTTAIHHAGETAPLAKTVGPPIQRGSTVLMPNARSLYDPTQVSYGRGGLEPQKALMSALTALEGGVGTRLFPNGLSAMTAGLMAVLAAGDDLLVVDSVYAPTRRFCDKVLAKFGVTTRYFDAALDAGQVMAMATPKTRAIVLESPGSLTFEIQDVPAIAAAARTAGILTLIDNTWGAGLYFKPLEHGVDISIQALTKYVGGHSDCFMGSAAVNDQKLLKMLDDAVWNFGWSVSPDDAYQMLRGLRTLPTRLAQHEANTLKIAAWLQEQPEVVEILCPALPGDRGHAVWKRDFHGQNGLLGMVLQPKPEAAVFALLDNLDLFGLGFSWGGFESLAIHCDPQFGARKIKPSFGGPLIRLHVGLEDADDLIDDLRQGLDAYSRA
ncbi:MAG: metC [Caulobacteraceae bacterium]|nr:metC [Caulobacteraceae bacterium]